MKQIKQENGWMLYVIGSYSGEYEESFVKQEGGTACYIKLKAFDSKNHPLREAIGESDYMVQFFFLRKKDYEYDEKKMLQLKTMIIETPVGNNEFEGFLFGFDNLIEAMDFIDSLKNKASFILENIEKAD